jgi:hypothetical protein
MQGFFETTLTIEAAIMLSPWGLLLAVGIAVLLSLAFLTLWHRRRQGAQLYFRLPHWLPKIRMAFTSRESVIFMVTLLVAAVPPALVFFDRWLSPPLPAQYFIGPWCGIIDVCQLQFPPYFIFVFLSIPALALLLRTQKVPEPGLFCNFRTKDTDAEGPRAIHPTQKSAAIGLMALSGVGLLGLGMRTWLLGQPPGMEYALLGGALTCSWWLRDVPLEPFWRSLRARGVRPDLLLIHILLVATLATIFTRRALVWIPTILLILSLLNLARSGRRVSHIFWLVSLALILYSLYLDAWWFAVIGDEYEFFYFARSIIADLKWETIWARFFDGQGVYGTHPFLSSLVQALSIRLFGVNNFGWRFSNLYLSALALFFLYKFFLAFMHQRVAFFAVLTLASSHYLMAFGKIGYNNLQAYFVLALNLAVATWALQNRRASTFFLLGGTLGLCFYTYPGALYTLAAVGCLLLFYFPPVSRVALQRWGALAGALSMWMYPIALQPAYWRAKLPGTLFAQAELVESVGSVVRHLASNLAYSFFSPVYIAEESHFVTISYLDLVSAGLFFMGFLYLLWQYRRHRTAAFLATSFILMLFLVGATHDRPTPSTTRMFLLLPWFALFAAFGAIWLHERASKLGWVDPSGRRTTYFFLVLIISVNLYQAYPLTRLRMIRYQSLQALFLKTAESLPESGTGTPTKFLFANNPATWNIDDLRDILDIYQFPPESIHVADLEPMGETLTAQDIQAFQDPEAYIILNPSLNSPWRRSAQDLLINQGRTSCEVRDGLGQPGLRIWYFPDLMNICQ